MTFSLRNKIWNKILLNIELQRQTIFSLSKTCKNVCTKQINTPEFNNVIIDLN